MWLTSHLTTLRSSRTDSFSEWMHVFPSSFFSFFWDWTSLIWTPHQEKSAVNILHFLRELLKMAGINSSSLTAEWSKLADTLWLAAVSAGWCGLFWSLVQLLPVSVTVASALSPSLLFWLNGLSDYLKLDYQDFFLSLSFTVSCLSQVTLTITMKKNSPLLFLLVGWWFLFFLFIPTAFTSSVIPASLLCYRFQTKFFCSLDVLLVLEEPFSTATTCQSSTHQRRWMRWRTYICVVVVGRDGTKPGSILIMWGTIYSFTLKI